METASRTLLRNGNLVLDGFAELQKSCDVLVQGNRIISVSQTPLGHDDAKVIDLAGRTLMPGLIDAHAHITGLSLSPKNISYPAAEIAVASANYLRCSLMDGFTSIREAGGADHGVARLLAEGKIIGPRLFYSGRAITQTGGGADFRTPDEVNDPCGQPGPFSVMSVIADGVDQVRMAAREELRRGASQIKVFVSGGVVFPSEGHPTIYEYSLEELRAIVEEARGRSTYVMAHVYTDEGVRRCLDAGVRSIEHANFVNEETVAKMAQSRAYLDPTFISLVQRIESAVEMGLPATIVENLKRTVGRGRQVYAWARRYGVPIAFGTDLWGPEAQKSQLREFEMRIELDDPPNVISSATRINAELLNSNGKLGEITPGAYADLLVVEGNPLCDLRVMTDPQRNLKLIMKDGVLYKNEI
ncbi:MAG TPA: amidohydrolase family protein [Candidatus Binataceae bacterium]|nr:amidohydrolase family protein [Candidatus Binataceae bacterium]